MPDPHVVTTVNTIRRVNPLIANLATRITADTTGILTNLGFIPALTGIARVIPGVGTAEVDVPCVAGVHVPLDIQAFDALNSTAGQELVILRQGGG